MSTIDVVKAENQRNYQKLIVALEASQGILNLLIAVCDDRNLREKFIHQYETELRQQDFLTYRIRVRNQDPSLRYAVAQLIEAEPDLQQGKPAVATCNTNRSNLQSRHLQTRIKCNYNFGSARINCN